MYDVSFSHNAQRHRQTDNIIMTIACSMINQQLSTRTVVVAVRLNYM